MPAPKRKKKKGKYPLQGLLEGKYALGGRPPKYTKREEVEQVFTDYCMWCIKSYNTMTKAGFLYFLNMSREAYGDYKANKEFSDTIKRIEFMIENDWLQRLRGQAPAGAIFYLKNAFKENYRDSYSTDLTSKDQAINFITWPELISKHGNKTPPKTNGSSK